MCMRYSWLPDHGAFATTPSRAKQCFCHNVTSPSACIHGISSRARDVLVKCAAGYLFSCRPHLTCVLESTATIRRTSTECFAMMLTFWQKCNIQPLQTCKPNHPVRQSDPQCVSLQQTAAKQPLDEASNSRVLPQRLMSKPQRQSAVHKRSQLAQHFDLHQLPKPALSKVKADNQDQPEPREINHWLVDSSSPEQVLGIYAQHQERFNIINMSTALHRLAKVYLWACPS